MLRHKDASSGRATSTRIFIRGNPSNISEAVIKKAKGKTLNLKKMSQKLE
jgi:hypothetical protein